MLAAASDSRQNVETLVEAAERVVTSARVALDRQLVASDDRVAIRLDQGELVLSGHVSSYYHKQLAQEAVLQLGVPVGLRNDLAVTGSD